MIYNNVVCTTSKASDQPAHMHSLIRAFASGLNILGVLRKLLTQQHLEFLSLKGSCTGSSESMHVSKCHIVGNHMSQLLFNDFIRGGSRISGKGVQ